MFYSKNTLKNIDYYEAQKKPHSIKIKINA
jgi:hypothetical protein